MFRPKIANPTPTPDDESLISAWPVSQDERRRKKRRRWKKVRRAFLISLLTLAISYASLSIYASVLLNRELAQVRAKGEPLTLAEMVPPVPEAQNAARLYQQAHATLDLKKGEEAKIADSLNPDTTLDPAALAALQRNRGALDLARQAAAMPQCRFPVDWNNKSPDSLLFPHYAELRSLARLLSAQARYKARTGDVEGALRDVRAIFGMSHHLRDEPVLIGFLVARAVDAMANYALSRVLEIAPIAAQQGQQFRASLPNTDWSAAYRRALMGERAFGPPRFKPFSWIPFFKLDEVYTLRLWKRHIDDLSPMQIPAPVGNAAQFDKAIQELPPYAILTRMMLPVFSHTRDHRDAAEVGRRQREVALALSAYHVAKGRYPAQLSEAQPLWDKPLPTDPYSSKPFVYRSDGRNFTLYSIGVNRIDEGGRAQRDRYKGPPPHPKGDDLRWNVKQLL